MNRPWRFHVIRTCPRRRAVRAIAATPRGRARCQGAPAAEVAGTVAAASYYRGDSVVLTHRVGQNRDFDIDLTAIHRFDGTGPYPVTILCEPPGGRAARRDR